MALDLKLGRGKQPAYPTKTTINLAVDSREQAIRTRAVATFAVALVAIALFAKFGVVDVMASAAAETAKVSSARAQLTALEESNAGYDELLEEYSAYVPGSLTDEERLLVDRGAVLDMLQSTVASSADLQAASIEGNTVLLQFVNASLEDVSQVVASLEGNSLVSGVAIGTAQTDRNEDVISTVTVTLGQSDSTSDGTGA